MNVGPPGTQTTIITFAIVALVVVRFLFRELRARTVRVRTIWIRPGLLAGMTTLLVAASIAIPGTSPLALAGAALVGAACGVVTGLLVIRSTSFAPAGERGAVIAKGSAVTVAIWLGALALRFIARYAFAGAGADQAEQFALNVGLVVLVTAAFTVVALGMHRAIDRLASQAKP